MKKKKRIFASAPSEQAQQTKKEVLSGKCLRTQHDKADRQTKLFKAADGIIAALKKRSALPVHANNPRAAFTLAEVLITLTIIGVVSALTIPTLVQKTNKQEYVSALQKAYSTLSQAANMIIAEEGSPKCSDGGWACSNKDVYNMFKKYISSAKDCGTAEGCFPQVQFKYLHNGLDGNIENNASSFRKIVLADGTQVIFSGETYISQECKMQGENDGGMGSHNYCTRIAADINGAKKPNQFGRDAFIFVLKENGLFPAGCDYEACIDNSSRGYGCACKVLREGKMDY